MTGEGDAWTSQAKVNLLPSLAADPDSLLPKVGDAEEVSVSLIPPLFLLLLPLNNNKNNNHKRGSCVWMIISSFDFSKKESGFEQEHRSFSKDKFSWVLMKNKIIKY